MCQVYSRAGCLCVKYTRYTVGSWVFVCQVYNRELGVCVSSIQ